MEEKLTLPEEEKVLLLDSIKKLQQLTGDMFTADDFRIIRDIMFDCEQQDALKRNAFGLNPIVFDLQTAIILAEEIGLNRASILSVLLHDSVAVGVRSIDYVKETFGDDVPILFVALSR